MWKPGFHQIRVGSFQHQVEMVAHQAMSMDLPIRLLASLGQSLKTPLTATLRRICWDQSPFLLHRLPRPLSHPCPEPHKRAQPLQFEALTAKTAG